MRQGFKSKFMSGLWAGALALAGLTAAHAGDGAQVPMGVAPVLVVPAPMVVPAAVTVPTRVVQIASSPVVQAAPSLGRGEEAGVLPGRGWHRKPGRAIQGRSPFWQYDTAQAGGAVVVQVVPQVWVP